MLEPREVILVTQEEINCMAPTIPIATHNMPTQIEDETLPCHVVNGIVDPDKEEILQ